MKTVKILPAMMCAVATLLGSVLAAPAGAAASTGATTDSVDAPARHCSLVAFDSATVKPDVRTGRLTLVVSGIKPSRFLSVELTPVVYFRQPEYWIILVNGCMPEVDLPVLTPYVATLDITATIGTEGIEVHGANQQVRIPVRPTDRFARNR